jgi:putative flippase GtrA
MAIMTMIEQLKFRFPRTAAMVEPHVGFVKKAISFGLVGVLNAGIDFAVFWPATHAFGLPAVPAKVVSWMVAVSGSYVMNSLITFAAESGGKLRWRAYAAFVLSGIAGMVASVVALALADWLLRSVVADHDLRLAAAWIAAVGASFVVNFSLSHFVVFRRRPATAQD